MLLEWSNVLTRLLLVGASIHSTPTYMPRPKKTTKRKLDRNILADFFPVPSRVDKKFDPTKPISPSNPFTIKIVRKTYDI